MAQTEKRYYWLKLQKDFFKRHDIRIIEAMPNGKDYILFYLKLLVESVGHEGELRFSELIPYNEEMLSVVTNTNIDVVKSAMAIFKQLNMIDVLDDDTIFMNEVSKMIGCETDWAKKKREYRELKKTEDNVLEMSPECPTDVPSVSDKSKSKIKSKNKSKSKSIEIDTEYIYTAVSDFGCILDEERENLINAIDEFWRMRSATKKAVNSEYAFKRLIAKLKEFTNECAKASKIIDQSIINGWTDIYPIKSSSKSGKNIATDWSDL